MRFPFEDIQEGAQAICTNRGAYTFQRATQATPVTLLRRRAARTNPSHRASLQSTATRCSSDLWTDGTTVDHIGYSTYPQELIIVPDWLQG